VLPETSYTFEEDPAIYGGVAAYPGALAQVANEGVVRQQRVAGIAAYPVQYNPATRELTIYESLTVHVTFTPSAIGDQPSAISEGHAVGDQPSAAGPAEAESAAYEQLWAVAAELRNRARLAAARQAFLPPAREGAEVGSEERTGVEGVGMEGVPWGPPEPAGG